MEFIICRKTNSYGPCYSQQCEIADFSHENWCLISYGCNRFQISLLERGIFGQICILHLQYPRPSQPRHMLEIMQTYKE